jgi:hypothetical protein
LILPHVFKIHSSPFENAVVIAGERGLDEAFCFYLEGANFFENFACGPCVIVIPSGAKRSRGIPLHYREALIVRKAYISENKSRHSGFLPAMSASFFARLQRLTCFSLAIALVGFEYASK